MNAASAMHDERPVRAVARRAILVRALALAAAGLVSAQTASASIPESCADQRGAVRWTARVDAGATGLAGRFRVYGGVGEPALFLFEIPAASGEAVYCYPLTGFLAVADRFELRFVELSGGEQVIGSFSRSDLDVRPSQGEPKLGRDFQIVLPSAHFSLVELDGVSFEPPTGFRPSGFRLEPPKPPPWRSAVSTTNPT